MMLSQVISYHILRALGRYLNFIPEVNVGARKQNACTLVHMSGGDSAVYLGQRNSLSCRSSCPRGSDLPVSHCSIQRIEVLAGQKAWKFLSLQYLQQVR
jgi:hypothetical protein